MSPAPSSLIATSSAEERAEPEQDDKGKKKKKKKNGVDATGKEQPGEVRTAAGRLRLKGRVLVQAALQHYDVAPLGTGLAGSSDKDVLDFSVDSVRISLDYQAPLRWITASAEMDLAGGRVSMKDGYVQARDKHWSVRAGQFKIPVSAIEMESPWTLPLARRGLLHSILTDWLDVAGRRPGVLVSYRTGAEPRFRLSAGAFQGGVVTEIIPGERDTDLIQRMSIDSKSLVGRADVEIGPLAVGAWYQHRVGSPEVGRFEHYETLGVDAVIDHALPDGGVRAWVEAMAGESWYEHPDKTEDDDTAIFVAGRAIGAFRWGGTVDEAPFIEPFGFVGAFEPDRDTARDLVWEAGVGINAGFWRRARLTVEGELNGGQRNFPSGYQLESSSPDRLSLLVQAGVAW